MNKSTKVLVSTLIIASLFAITGCNDTKSNNGSTVNNGKVESNKNEDTVDSEKKEDTNNNTNTTDNKNTTENKTETNNTDNKNTNTNANTGTDNNKETNASTEKVTLQEIIAQYLKNTYGDKSNIGKDRINNIDMQPGSTGAKTLMIEINADSNESSKKVLASMNKISKDIIIKTKEFTKKDNLAQDIVITFFLPIGQNGANEQIYQVNVDGMDVLKKDWSTIEPTDLKNHVSVITNDQYFSLNP